MASDAEFDVQMKKDDEMISKFRNILRKIKETVQDKYTLKSQDTSVVNRVEKELTQFFEILYPIVYRLKSLDTIPEKLINLRKYFKETLQDYQRSSYYQNLLQYYLIHDLIKYPLDNSVVANNTQLTEIVIENIN
jgi:hypothetical protein